ncbi:MAG: hypothetical protein RIS08_154 [Actinomycetota bacterium]|jgi:integrase
MKKSSKREFGSIRMLDSGKFQATYKFGGRTIYNPQAFLTKGEAKSWLAAEQFRLMNGERPDKLKKPQPCTFGECATEYLELKTNRDGYPLSPSYVAKCQQHLKGKLSVFVNEDIATISSQMIEAWWVRETRQGHRASTANAYRFLRAVLRKAVRDGQHDGPNPCQILGAGSAKSGSQLAAISSSELASIVSFASPQFAVYLTLSFVAAMRFEEATALRVSDVIKTQIDGAPSYSLRISKSVVRVGGEFVVGPTKTKAGSRITHLPTSIHGMLENYLGSLTDGPESLLFPSEQQGTYIHNSVLNKQLKRVCNAAGLESKRFTLHSLRRGGATALSENGATPAEVQQLLGDQSLAAAMLYVRPTTRLAALIEKFDLSGVS